jgi:fructose-bisphosphate aldolase class I
MIDLSARARMLSCAPKGILAADESNASADKRLSTCGIKTTKETRRKYRELFLDAERIEDYLNGVILFEETLEQKDDKGKLFPDLLHKRNIMVGIKVDQGTEPFSESPDELITKGLIGLPERLALFKKKHNIDFTKWRAVITIDGDRLPTSGAILENARRLASYARMVQEAGMVPVIEPEVLYDGKHSLLKSREVIEKTLTTVVAMLEESVVDPSSVVIKTSMALSGKDTGRIDKPSEVAKETLAALRASVPRDIPGIVFLSGGQEDDQATENLRAIHALAKKEPVPWNLTYSYARAIQEDALSAWQCKDENVPEARKAFLARLEKLTQVYGEQEGTCIEL